MKLRDVYSSTCRSYVQCYYLQELISVFKFNEGPLCNAHPRCTQAHKPQRIHSHNNCCKTARFGCLNGFQACSGPGVDRMHSLRRRHQLAAVRGETREGEGRGAQRRGDRKLSARLSPEGQGPPSPRQEAAETAICACEATRKQSPSIDHKDGAVGGPVGL